MKNNVALSDKAVRVINELLSNGERVQISFNSKSGELVIHQIPPYKTKYKVVVTNR